MKRALERGLVAVHRRKHTELSCNEETTYLRQQAVRAVYEHWYAPVVCQLAQPLNREGEASVGGDVVKHGQLCACERVCACVWVVE